jgi:hypothetical protein
MSQLFPKSANAIARMSLVGAVAALTIVVWVVFTLMRSSFATKQYEFVDQPVQFSHLHHVGGEGIDCRYCHTSVERSSFAGIPPTRTCMNCHSQLWTNAKILEPVRTSFTTNTPLTWIRVHDLPDFVYFNHQIHVHQGVGCATCHGRVDKMPLMYQASPLLMEWCLDCHRAPEKYLRPRDKVFQMDYEAPDNQIELGLQLKKEYHVSSVEHMTSCSTCHR